MNYQDTIIELGKLTLMQIVFIGALVTAAEKQDASKYNKIAQYLAIRATRA